MGATSYKHKSKRDNTMLTRLLIAATLATVASTAYAADTGASNTNSTSGMTPGQQSSQSLPQEIRSKLQQDGFTNVQVVPGSFLVSAKDKRGDPVTMVIGPHSMLVMSEGKIGTNDSAGGSQSQNDGQVK
jgi:hypothetical protein